MNSNQSISQKIQYQEISFTEWKAALGCVAFSMHLRSAEYIQQPRIAAIAHLDKLLSIFLN